MEKDKHAVVLRILDDQNRLTDRADTKAISLLSTLGIFSVFFIAHFTEIPVEPFSIFLLIVYFVTVLSAIIHIVLAISPRIGSVKKKKVKAAAPPSQPIFFGGISQFQNVEAYKKSLDETLKGDNTLTDSYIQTVYEVSKINNTKYAYVRRAVRLVVVALTAQLALVAYTFIVFK
jgi:hypothetical protein